MDEIIAEISNKFPFNTWLQNKLKELVDEYTSIKSDRNHLVEELSRQRSIVNQLRAELQDLRQGLS